MTEWRLPLDGQLQALGQQQVLIQRLAETERRIEPQREGFADRSAHRGSAYWYSVPVLITGCASLSEHSTTSRFDTIAARRSSSR